MDTYILVIAYLCGSIPFGLILGKIVGKSDVREQGSGSIGATNVTRMLGKKWGAVVVLLDGFKAFIPIMIAKMFGLNETILALTALCAIIGHIFPIWLGFKGGKGVASLIFSLFALDYRLGVVYILLWGLVYLLFHISALSALISLIITTICAFVFSTFTYFLLLCGLTFLIFYKHKENIDRMLKGEENSFKK